MNPLHLLPPCLGGWSLSSACPLSSSPEGEKDEPDDSEYSRNERILGLNCTGIRLANITDEVAPLPNATKTEK